MGIDRKLFLLIFGYKPTSILGELKFRPDDEKRKIQLSGATILFEGNMERGYLYKILLAICPKFLETEKIKNQKSRHEGDPHGSGTLKTLLPP